MTPRSVAEVRELLGDEAVGLTDAEVIALRDQTVAFAELVVRGYRATRRSVGPAGCEELARRPRRPRVVIAKRSA